MNNEAFCEWEENDPWGPIPNTFDGTCGICYTMDYLDEVEGRSLALCDVNYCPKCGKKIKQIDFPREADDEQ